MNELNIVMTRIDNRLVHGQVGVTWTNSINADTIVVVDDDVAIDGIRQKLMESVANAADVDIRFYNVDNFAERYHSVESNQKLFIVLRTPLEARRLVEKGVHIKKVNIGNMHYERGRVPLNRKVYVTEEDIDSFNYLLDNEVSLFYQDVPGTGIDKIGYLKYEDLKRRR